MIKRISQDEIVHLARKVLKAVGTEYGVEIADIQGPRKTATIAEARLVAMYLLVLAGFTTILAGAVVKRSHGNVVHGRKRVLSMMAEKPEFGARVNKLAAALGLNASTQEIAMASLIRDAKAIVQAWHTVAPSQIAFRNAWLERANQLVP